MKVRTPAAECPPSDWGDVVELGSDGEKRKAAAIAGFLLRVIDSLKSIGPTGGTLGETALLRLAICDASASAWLELGPSLVRDTLMDRYKEILRFYARGLENGKKTDPAVLDKLRDLAVWLQGFSDGAMPVSLDRISHETRKLAKREWPRFDHKLDRSAAGLYVVLAAMNDPKGQAAIDKAMDCLESLALHRTKRPDLSGLLSAAENLNRTYWEAELAAVVTPGQIAATAADLRRILNILDLQNIKDAARDSLGGIQNAIIVLRWTLDGVRQSAPIDVWRTCKESGFDVDLLAMLESGDSHLDKIIKGRGTSENRQALLTLADEMERLAGKDSGAESNMSPPAGPPTDKAKRKGRPGRKPKYMRRELEQASKMYDAQIELMLDSKGAWEKVRETFDQFPSGDAARKAVTKWKSGQN
jgi:hypothetical protein